VYSDSSTPSWTTSAITGGDFTIANIMFNYDANTTYIFKTKLGGSGFPNPNYYLRFSNPLADTQPSWGQDGSANTPCGTSLVNVQHIPATGQIPKRPPAQMTLV
jgi:hypothetical protein